MWAQGGIRVYGIAPPPSRDVRNGSPGHSNIAAMVDTTTTCAACGASVGLAAAAAPSPALAWPLLDDRVPVDARRVPKRPSSCSCAAGSASQAAVALRRARPACGDPKIRDYKGLHAFPSNITRDDPPITRDYSSLPSNITREVTHVHVPARFLHMKPNAMKSFWIRVLKPACGEHNKKQKQERILDPPCFLLPCASAHS